MSISLENGPLKATFHPEKGMNLLSFLWQGVELIDQGTKEEFENRFCGLGPLTGPHFLRRKVIPSLPHGVVFPHFDYLKTRKETDPFAHGIARYAPWRVEKEGKRLKGMLLGSDMWQGVPLKDLEGQNFAMEMEAYLSAQSLHVALSCVSDTDSVVSTHYYWRLPEKKGSVLAEVSEDLLQDGQKVPFPAAWKKEGAKLQLLLDQSYDHTFHSVDSCGANITLQTPQFDLLVEYKSPNQENAWQLYHPEGSSFVCIEPVSSYNPLKPHLTVNSIEIKITPKSKEKV